MPNTRKNTSADTEKDLTFEEALSSLEKIVSAMEGEELDLESLLSNYREGTRLSGVCQEKLSQAEVLIKRLDEEAAKIPAEESES